LAVYTERFSLPFLAQVLVAAAERQRPGLGAWTDEAAAALRATFQAELAELKRRFFEVFDDQAYWAKVESSLLEVCLPRYLAEARRFNELERRDFGVWRGGDLIARATLALGGLLVGAFLVKAPFIPIPSTWDALILGLGISAPFLPDAQIWLHQRRYRRRLKAIVEDMKDAEAQLQLYRPLPVAEIDPSSTRTEQPERLREKG
jgi:hypothetical protein